MASWKSQIAIGRIKLTWSDKEYEFKRLKRKKNKQTENGAYKNLFCQQKWLGWPQALRLVYILDAHGLLGGTPVQIL